VPSLALSDVAWIASGIFLPGTALLVVHTARARRQSLRKTEIANAATHLAQATIDSADVSADTNAAFDRLIDRQALDQLLTARKTRSTVVHALADAARQVGNDHVVDALSDGARAAVLKVVLEEMRAPDPGIRARALEAAAALVLRDLRGAMMEMVNDHDHIVCVAACRALIAVDPELAIGEILRLVETEGVWAADLLADVVERNAITVSDALIARTGVWASTPALVTLVAASQSPFAVDTLVAALDNYDTATQMRAATGLATAGSLDAIATLQRLVHARDAEVRTAAAQALGTIGDRSAMSGLTSALDDGDRGVRLTAARALLKVPGGVELLRRAAADHDPLVAEAANSALLQSSDDDLDGREP
jgi:HEAT repeat protein